MDCKGSSAATCKGRCKSNGKEKATCQCDSKCIERGDCCADKSWACGDLKKDHRTPVAIEALADGKAVVLLQSARYGWPSAEVCLVDANNAQTQWRAHITGNANAKKGKVTAKAIAVSDKGEVAVVGSWSVNDLFAEHLIASLTKTGKLKWLHSPTAPDFGEANAVVVGPDQHVTASGYVKSKGVTQLALWQLDGDGKLLWTRASAFATAPKGTLVVRPGLLKRLATGLLVGAGLVLEVNNKFYDYPAIARADKWGHFDCIGAGLCAAKSADSCDDNKPCTADVCDSKLGCVHAPVTGPACGVGGVCVKGSCQGG